jgi:hypothetical protein
MKTIPICINLREKFGRRFRIEREEGCGRIDDPWLLIIPCRFGHIFPHGGNTLAASVDAHPNIAGMLRRLPCCRIHQDGAFGELTVLFDIADFAKVARIMRPRRRRQVSESQKAVMVARLHNPRQEGDFTPIHGHPTPRPCVGMARHDFPVEAEQLPLFRS